MDQERQPTAAEMINEPWQARDTLALHVFRPATPVDEDGLFAGRRKQIQQVVDAVVQPGRHAIVFGERGVGKTSLANILGSRLHVEGGRLVAPRVNCDSQDDYASLWRKVFVEMRMSVKSQSIGFGPSSGSRAAGENADAPDIATTDDVRRHLASWATRNTVVMVILDELDRLTADVKRMLADTIKTLSDHNVPASLVLVGVADTVDELIAEHHSVERALVQVQMPRMSKDELEEIVTVGLGRLSMAIEAKALAKISFLSQGLPHYAHLLGLHAAREAIDARVRTINHVHLDAAIKHALEQAQQTVRHGYHTAIASNRRDNLFGKVLLACALAQTDEFGYFAAADVRAPFRQITGKDYDIPAFASHLNGFASAARGRILERTGAPRTYRFRFANPLMPPYVTMQGFATNALAGSAWRATPKR